MSKTPEDIERRDRCARIAHGIANSLWNHVPTEVLAALVDHGHEPDEEGVASFETLYDAVLSWAYTNAFVAYSCPVPMPFLHDPPADKNNSNG